MEAISVVAIITAVTALVVSFLSHIKTSSCYGLNLQTTDYEKIKE